jgi:hypothetical protein
LVHGELDPTSLEPAARYVAPAPEVCSPLVTAECTVQGRRNFGPRENCAQEPLTVRIPVDLGRGLYDTQGLPAECFQQKAGAEYSDGTDYERHQHFDQRETSAVFSMSAYAAR